MQRPCTCSFYLPACSLTAAVTLVSTHRALQADVECEFGYEFVNHECRPITGLDTGQCGALKSGAYHTSASRHRLIRRRRLRGRVPRDHRHGRQGQPARRGQGRRRTGRAAEVGDHRGGVPGTPCTRVLRLLDFFAQGEVDWPSVRLRLRSTQRELSNTSVVVFLHPFYPNDPTTPVEFADKHGVLYVRPSEMSDMVCMWVFAANTAVLAYLSVQSGAAHSYSEQVR